MLEQSDREQIRVIVETVVRTHLCSLTEACIVPLMAAIEQVQLNQKLIADGQLLVEKSLVARLPDDDERWQ
jgi:hypothetical protein